VTRRIIRELEILNQYWGGGGGGGGEGRMRTYAYTDDGRERDDIMHKVEVSF
jgi:single-stranded DNA-binding protein